MLLDESSDCGLEQAVEFINSRPWNPLCLYCFSSSVYVRDVLQQRTSTGNMAFNDTIVQFASKRSHLLLSCVIHYVSVSSL